MRRGPRFAGALFAFPSGALVAILRRMLGILRFAFVFLAVLIVAVVFAMCGEGAACAGCLDACCAKADRGDRLSLVVSRMLAALRSCAPVGNQSAGVTLVSRANARGRAVLLESRVVPLRV